MPTAEQLQEARLNFNQLERHRDDTETWLAEVLDGSMRTEFEFSSDGQELYGTDGGALGVVFDDAIEAAQLITEENPSLLFELRRRIIEKGEYEDMLAMSKGELFDENGDEVNLMVVVSDFPPELMSATEDTNGYNTERQQTMMRVISRLPDGGISMVTQSLDGSNRQALEAIYGRLGVQPEAGELLGQRVTMHMPDELHDQAAQTLTAVYDQSLEEQFDGKWHAGIRQVNAKKMDTYEFAREQTDLVSMFVEAKMQDSVAAEKMRYELAATASKRWSDYNADLREVGQVTTHTFFAPVAVNKNLADEMRIAAMQAAAAGQVFSGCGGSVGPEGTAAEMRQAGYGNKADEDEFGPLTFNCTDGHTNTRPKGKLIDKCRVKTCEGTVGC